MFKPSFYHYSSVIHIISDYNRFFFTFASPPQYFTSLFHATFELYASTIFWTLCSLHIDECSRIRLCNLHSLHLYANFSKLILGFYEAFQLHCSQLQEPLASQRSPLIVWSIYLNYFHQDLVGLQWSYYYQPW